MSLPADLFHGPQRLHGRLWRAELQKSGNLTRWTATPGLCNHCGTVIPPEDDLCERRLDNHVW